MVKVAEMFYTAAKDRGNRKSLSSLTTKHTQHCLCSFVPCQVKSQFTHANAHTHGKDKSEADESWASPTREGTQKEE